MPTPRQWLAGRRLRHRARLEAAEDERQAAAALAQAQGEEVTEATRTLEAARARSALLRKR